MTIQQVTTNAAATTAQPASAAPPQAQPTPSVPRDEVTLSGPTRRDVPAVQIDRLLNSNAVSSLVGQNLKNGDTIQISQGDQVVLEVRKEGVSSYQRFKSFAADTIQAGAAEVSNIVAQDPAFAFKESALGVKDQVFNGIPENLKGMAEKGFLPMIRVVALALDGKKAYDTWHIQGSPMEKFVDTGHVATDIAGLGGAVCLALPAINPTIGTVLSVVGLVGDVGAYGYHVMKYFQDRGMTPPDPGPPPAPPVDPTPPSPTPEPTPAPAPDPPQ
jgi:hypothetical protein